MRVLIFTKRTQKYQTDITIVLYIKDAEGESQGQQPESVIRGLYIGDVICADHKAENMSDTYGKDQKILPKVNKKRLNVQKYLYKIRRKKLCLKLFRETH